MRTPPRNLIVVFSLQKCEKSPLQKRREAGHKALLCALTAAASLPMLGVVLVPPFPVFAKTYLTIVDYVSRTHPHKENLARPSHETTLQAAVTSLREDKPFQHLLEGILRHTFSARPFLAAAEPTMVSLGFNGILNRVILEGEDWVSLKEGKYLKGGLFPRWNSGRRWESATFRGNFEL
jgi:hypothetical protein